MCFATRASQEESATRNQIMGGWGNFQFVIFNLQSYPSYGRVRPNARRVLRSGTMSRMRIGKYLRVVTEPSASINGDAIELVITRGAFGSGEHETTLSCLEILEDLDSVADAELLDLGSGTGILAIAALALGARSAVCVDPNPKAVATARHNCGLNGFDGRVEHVTGTLTDVQDSDFDLVLANIYVDVLLGSAADLVDHARPGATLVLSGIAWEDVFDVEIAYLALGCELANKRMMNEYCTLVMTKT
jgi:ribosomal protein L11 methyltransferase